MSYCRWSTDNFRCDLYCYQDASGGWTTHVAGSRYVGDVPEVDFSLMEKQPPGWAEEVSRQMRAQHEWCAAATHESIGGPHDGRTFHDPTLQAFSERLLMLRAAGYRFPDDVLESVAEEMREAAHD